MEHIQWRQEVVSLLVLWLLLAQASCHGPLGPFAGRKLAGRLNDRPVTDWTFANRFPLMQIEVRPADPYSVNVDFYVVAGKLYIEAGTRTWSHWRRLLRDDQRVRIRFGDTVYERLAREVSDETEIAAILPTFFEKDGADPPPGCEATWAVSECLPDDVEFFRLDPP